MPFNSVIRLVRVISFLLRISKSVRHARASLILAVLAGVISGASNTALIALISAAVGGRTLTKSMLWSFIGLCLLQPACRFASNTLLARLTARGLLELRLQICRRLLATPLRALEELGSHRLLAALVDDGSVISGALAGLPLLFMHLSIVVASCIYLAWLSWTLFLFIFGILAFSVIIYQIPLTRSAYYFRLFREEWDTLVKHFQAVTGGAKELKLHRRRRESFHRQLLRPSATSLAQSHIAGSDIFAFASSLGQVVIFALIGLLLFPRPSALATTPQVMASYCVTLLYVMVPLEVILTRLSEINRAGVAIDKIESLGLSLASEPGEDRSGKESILEPEWSTLNLAGVTHSYRIERENLSFTLGPLDLTLRRGELLFLIGGNGSGKTTLAKLLTGLYYPEAGEIRLDGRKIDDREREDYRQLFSAVFSDFFLFESVLGLEFSEIDDQAQRYLNRLQLNHKVRVDNGVFSAIDLSQGQRKRLALLTAYLEDRPIYLFDEWAADQDPAFKEVFYCELLPDLKALGKTIIVITHDDRYHHVADRIIKLEYGKIEYDKSKIEVFPAVEFH